MKTMRLLMSITILFSILAASGAIAAPAAPDSPDELRTLTQVGALESSLIRDIIVQGTYALFGPTYAIALPQVSYGSDTSEVILP